MKKWSAWLLLAVLVLSLCSCKTTQSAENELQKLGLDSKMGTESLRVTCKNGYQGGSLLRLVVDFREDMGERIRKDHRWNPCPMDEDTRNFICRDVKGISKSVAGLHNGYYILMDHSGQTLEPGQEKYRDLVAAVYDMDQQILYYCEVDS